MHLGAQQVQGTINGYGERCGNANLCTIIPNLKLKMNVHPITDEEMRKLRETSYFVSEIANLRPNDYDPYVGKVLSLIKEEFMSVPFLAILPLMSTLLLNR